MRDLSGDISPLERGFEGGVTVKGAAWVEGILLLFGEVVFLGFGWLLLILGSYAQASHPPAPLWDGEVWMQLFYLGMRGL